MYAREGQEGLVSSCNSKANSFFYEVELDAGVCDGRGRVKREENDFNNLEPI